MVEDDLDLFIPGRLCLFGEHSDWAGGHRRQNSEIEKGYAIVAPTNQGIYAKIRKLDHTIFKFKSTLLDKTFEEKLEKSKLSEIAEKGDIFSYISGVACEVVENYDRFNESGLEIDNYKTTLPVKKGLSSSASICVLTARAFNLVYNLGWTKKREMDVAYAGEIRTPSRCGRLDQACAYNNPILMVFDGDKIDVRELRVGGDIHLLIVDLNSKKDTRKILAELSKGFPFSTNTEEIKKQDYLGPINKHIVYRAVRAIEEGDSKRLGKLMKECQEKFDNYLAPACPEELNAPELHKILSMKEIQDYIHGGKGVGSQGDGSAQLVCKSGEDREKVKILLDSKGYKCLDLDLKKN